MPVFVVCVPPLPGLDFSALIVLMARRVAVAILSDACWSMLGDVVLLAVVVLDVVMDHGPLEGARG